MGATDEMGRGAVENRYHIHDLHATILHLMGLDDMRLTYYHGGAFQTSHRSGRSLDEGDDRLMETISRRGFLAMGVAGAAHLLRACRCSPVQDYLSRGNVVSCSTGTAP